MKRLEDIPESSSFWVQSKVEKNTEYNAVPLDNIADEEKKHLYRPFVWTENKEDKDALDWFS